MPEKKIPFKEKLMLVLHKLLFLTMGAFIAAFALECFLVPNNIIDGGIVGISIIVSYFRLFLQILHPIKIRISFNTLIFRQQCIVFCQFQVRQKKYLSHELPLQ